MNRNVIDPPAIVKSALPDDIAAEAKALGGRTTAESSEEFPMKHDFIFFKRVRCLRACDYDRPYQPGDERELECLVTAATEEAARRSIINHEMDFGWQVLALRLVSRSP